MLVSPKQIRAARALLNWTAKDLASRVRMSPATVSMIENEQTDGSIASITAIYDAFTRAGIEFLDGNGLRQKGNTITTYQGNDGFTDFLMDVLSSVQSGPTEICVSNVDEREFDKWGTPQDNEHYRQEMAKIDTYTFRILVREGDTHFTASKYAEYRWLPYDLFGEISFYTYGDKTAIISFEDNDFNAFVLSHPRITAFYKKEFNRLWASSKEAKVKKR